MQSVPASLLRVCLVLCALLPAGPSHAQSGVPAPLEPLKVHDPAVMAAIAASESVKVTMPASPAISPDGTLLAYTLGRGADERIHLIDLSAGSAAKDRTISSKEEAACTGESPVWSPDGTWLAYTSTCPGVEGQPAQAQIFLWSKVNGTTKQLSRLKGLFDQVAWAADGRTLAFLFVENATRSAGALAAMKPWSGVIGEDGIEVQRVASLEVASGAITLVTPATLHVFEFTWASDGKQIAYVAAAPPGENNWWVAGLYTQHLDTKHLGAAPRLVLDPKSVAGPLHGLQIAVPRFSPDGKRLAFIGGLMSDQGSTGGDIWVVDAQGSVPMDLTPGIDGTPTYLQWNGNERVGFVEQRRGRVLIRDYSVSRRAEVAGSSIDLGEVSLTGGVIKDALSASTNGMLALVKTGAHLPPEVWAGPRNGLAQVTHWNDAARGSGGGTESLEWTNEGFQVQGWLTYPASYDPAKKYPLLVDVHGGPSASAGPRWGAMAAYSQAGYFVFQPNPRGSFGQGAAFTQANRKDFGYGDLRDILAGMDAIEKKLPIDPKREGLTGWSYGGFMTMFAVTQTGRFRAAVAGAGISDWQSYYGENSIDQWMTPFFGATVYDDPAVYARSSAITYIKQVKTPTLVIVGDRDGECPAPQSFEFWHALRAIGVKTQLVVYPNEGHHFADPGHVRDRLERELTWFQHEMPAS